MYGLSVTFGKQSRLLCAIIAQEGRGDPKMLHSPEVSNILRRRLERGSGRRIRPLRATISNDEGARKAMIYGLFRCSGDFKAAEV